MNKRLSKPERAMVSALEQLSAGMNSAADLVRNGVREWHAVRAHKKKGTHICEGCRKRVTPVFRGVGNRAIEFGLWFFYPAAGLCYTLIDGVARRMECPKCSGHKFREVKRVDRVGDDAGGV